VSVLRIEESFECCEKRRAMVNGQFLRVMAAQMNIVWPTGRKITLLKEFTYARNFEKSAYTYAL